MMSAKDKKLENILHEYSKLPEYSELSIPSVTSVSLFGDYPIHIAAIRGSIDEISTLLNNGAEIDAAGEHGYTALHDAVEQGHFKVVEFLLQRGASITIKNNDGVTPAGLAELLEEGEIYSRLK